MSIKHTKRMIFIDATRNNIDNTITIKQIWENCSNEYIDFLFVYHEFKGLDCLEEFFKSYDEDAAVVYISSHGISSGLQMQSSNGDFDCDLDWDKLSLILCESDSLKENTTLFLGSCLGGFKRTALQMMSNCDFINYVAGLPCELVMPREALAFHVFCNHLERGSDARRIENAVTTAIEQQFNVFVRSEMDVEIALYASGYNELFLIQQDELG